MIITSPTKTLSLLALITLTAACSTQHHSSTPNSQLVGQQQAEVVKTTTVSDVPINTDTPKPMRKTILKAPPIVANNRATNSNRYPTSAFGVTTTAPKQRIRNVKKPRVITIPPPIVVPTQPKSVVAVVDKPAMVIPKPIITQPIQQPIITPPVQQKTTRRLTLNGSATFNTNSSTLSNEGKQRLTSLARSLSSPSTTVTRLLIEGHTDSVGSAASNQVLSLKRANTVANYLTQQGILRSSMVTAGLGESEPIADNKTTAGRALNRRVEITATGSRQTIR